MPAKKTKKPIRGAAKRPASRQMAKTGNLNHGRTAPPAAPASPPPTNNIAPGQLPDAKSQYAAFERAIQWFHKRNFQQAKELFQTATAGPSRELAANAQSHVRMCERRLEAPAPAPKTLEEHYNYAIALLNARQLEAARQHLETALRLDPRADHVHYAMAVCRVLNRDLAGAYDSLKRAIELQPRNRRAARQDPDLEEIVNQPPFSGLLRVEKHF